ncbi:MAG: DUF2066 domain-containing protein [Rhodospirillales bacterium]|nr:DUF2066 domain-containing protein [Rhodospirillales bacterium]
MALRALVLGFAVAVAAGTAGLAQVPAPAAIDVFAVRGVEVDRSAATAAQARDQAIAEGQRLAWRRLVERMVPAEARGPVLALPVGEIVPLIDSFEVESERGSGTRWIGALGYRFRSNDVRQLFRGRGVAYAETPARRLLVLPVAIRDGQVQLWEDDNAWRVAWSALPPPTGLQPWVLPLADVEDAGLIGAEQAATLDRARLRALAARHGTQGVVVVSAETDEAGVSGASVQVQFSRVGAPAPDADWSQVFRLSAGETAEAAWPRIARASAELIEERWKAEVLVQGGDVTTLRATIPVADLAEWIAVRRRLAEVATVRRLDVLVLGRGGAIVDIQHEGGTEALRTALAQRDVALEEEEGNWRLQLVERGGRRP